MNPIFVGITKKKRKRTKLKGQICNVVDEIKEEQIKAKKSYYVYRCRTKKKLKRAKSLKRVINYVGPTINEGRKENIEEKSEKNHQ
jgi:hypothetical protein